MVPASGPDALDEGRDPFNECRTMEPLELVPCGERARVDDAVQEQLAVEVVALVLERAGGQPATNLVVRNAVAIEVTSAHVHVPHHRPAQVGHGQTALVD